MKGGGLLDPSRETCGDLHAPSSRWLRRVERHSRSPDIGIEATAFKLVAEPQSRIEALNTVSSQKARYQARGRALRIAGCQVAEIGSQPLAGLIGGKAGILVGQLGTVPRAQRCGGAAAPNMRVFPRFAFRLCFGFGGSEMVNNPAPGMVAAGQMAKLLDLTPERLRQLARDGHIPRAVKGRYPLVGAVQGYLRWLQDDDRRAAQSRPGASLASARAREIQLRIAAREAEIIDADDVAAFHEFQSRVHREELSDLGATASRDLILAGQINVKIGAALARFDARFDEAISKLRAGLDPLGDTDA